MERKRDRNSKSKQKRKFKFFTDTESHQEPSSSSDLSEPKEIHPNNKFQNQSRNLIRLRDIFRRNYKFLTETEYSNPLSSEYDEDSQNPKRGKSPLPFDSNTPKKKIKSNEENEIDLSKVVQQGFDFVDKIRAKLPNIKK